MILNKNESEWQRWRQGYYAVGGGKKRFIWEMSKRHGAVTLAYTEQQKNKDQNDAHQGSMLNEQRWENMMSSNGGC